MRDGDGHYEEFSSVLCLCEAEALSSLVDGEQQLLAEHFIRRVLRKIDLVEACDEERSSQPWRSRTAREGLGVGELTSVRLWETVGVAVCLVYREALSALDALELDEAAERHPRSARREAEHLRPLLAVEGLECAPEPNNNGV